MNGTKRVRSTIVGVCAIGLAIGGCATDGSGIMGGGDPCNPMLGAIVGAALGAVVTSGTNRVRGAAAGTAVGALACIAVNAATRQTRTARDVEDDYRKKNGGQLPRAEPVVQDYAVNLVPTAPVRPGDAIQLTSTMTVVGGATEPVREVKEVLILTGPQGTRTAEKLASERPGSGSFENTFRLSFPKDVGAGSYPVKTQLFVNGKMAAERQRDVQIVLVAGAIRVAAIVDR